MEMDKLEFLGKMGRFISGPEHNAYYDVLEILEVCLSVMTPEQRWESFDFMEQKNKVSEVVEPKRKNINVKPVLSVKEAEVIICLLDQEAKRVKSPTTENL